MSPSKTIIFKKLSPYCQTIRFGSCPHEPSCHKRWYHRHFVQAYFYMNIANIFLSIASLIFNFISVGYH